MNDHHSVVVMVMTAVFQVIFERKLEILINSIYLLQAMDHESFAVAVAQ